MKRLLSLGFIALSLFISSCGSDKCSASNWTGTYKGSATCQGQSLEITATIVQVLGIATVTLEYEIGGDSDPNGFTFNPDGCTANVTSLDGDQFNLELDGDSLKIIDSSEDEPCSYTLKK